MFTLHPTVGNAPLAMAFILGTIALMRHVASSWWLAPLRHIGRRSIIYYLCHAFALGTLVPVLSGEFTDPGPHFVVSFALALGACVAVDLLERHVPLTRLAFEFPAKRARRAGLRQASARSSAAATWSDVHPKTGISESA